MIIEDDGDIADIEKDFLSMNGFSVHVENDGKSGLSCALSDSFDLIILDLMLPFMSGWDICKAIRNKTDVPILMVTARTSDLDKIRGLGMGADDYIEKPFSPSVLVAKVKSHLATYQRLKGKQTEEDTITISEITVNVMTHQFFICGREIEMKNKEYELLLFFMRNPGNVYSREDLYEEVWGLDALGDNATVTVHINRLREKIEENPSEPKHILTIHGAGYRFV